MQYDNGDGKFRLSGHPKPVYTEGKNIEVEFLSGCFMCYRKSVLEHVRIDTNIEFYDEDVDLSYRVSREYKCVYAHKACLNHKATPSGRDKSYIKSRDSIRSQIYIFRKNIPKEPINVITFFLSIIGFFILRILTLDIRGFFGGIDGVLKWNLLERSVIP